MTVIAKSNPVGIDKSILRFQNELEGMRWSNTDIHGRLYINKRKDDTILEAYRPTVINNEVFLDDAKTAVLGFVADDSRDGGTRIKTNVTLICSVDLDKLYTSDTRDDEEALMETMEAIMFLIQDKESIKISTGIEKVFSMVSWERYESRNQQPWFNFSISFDLFYKNLI